MVCIMSEEPNGPPEPEPAVNPEDELIPLDELLDFARIDENDLDAAILWWNENAPEAWRGALG